MGVLRRLFTIGSVVSLLLCAGMVGLWVRSYWVADDVRVGRVTATGFRGIVLETACGQLRVGACEVRRSGPGSVREQRNWIWNRSGLARAVTIAHEPLFFRFDRIAWSSAPFPTAGGGFAVVSFDTIRLPFWLVCAVLVTAPVLWLRGYARARRARLRASRGQCSCCGYDLTGNTSGVCPECGAACKSADPAFTAEY